MTRAGALLSDVPSRVPWTALRSFVAHLDASSALVREMRPEAAEWRGTERVQSILADIYDAVACFQWTYVAANREHGKPRKPRPYPRPGQSKGTSVGRDPIPIKDFDAWWSGGDAR